MIIGAWDKAGTMAMLIGLLKNVAAALVAGWPTSSGRGLMIRSGDALQEIVSPGS